MATIADPSATMPVANGLLDVGGASLVEVLGLDVLCELMVEHTGAAPRGIVYPALSTAGPNWDSKLARSGVLTDRGGPASLLGVARYCQAKGLQLWLVVSPNLSFLSADGTECVDSRGNSSASCCINSKPFQRTLSALLREAAAALRAATLPEPAGIVFDSLELWPMGEQQGAVQLNCFCRYCVAALNSHNFGDHDLEMFKRYPGPLNLLLEATSTGMRHAHDFKESIDRVRLIKYSYYQNFVARSALASDVASQKISLEGELQDELERSINGKQLLRWADSLLKYLSARQASSFSSLKLHFEQLRQIFPHSQRAITMEDLSYDWTSGMFQEAAFKESFYDEAWITASQVPPTGKPCRIYTCGRGRYTVQSLITSLETTKSPLRNITNAGNDDRLRRFIDHITKRACAAVLREPVQFQALDHPESSQGYV